MILQHVLLGRQEASIITISSIGRILLHRSASSYVYVYPPRRRRIRIILMMSSSPPLLLPTTHTTTCTTTHRWIHELLHVSTETAAADPLSWPPRNKDIAYDWNLPTHQVYKRREDDGDDDDDDDDNKNEDDDDEIVLHRDNDNNNNKAAHLLFTPTFAIARSRLDYAYHSNLVLRRQLLQDSILAKVATAAAAAIASTAASETSREKDENDTINSIQQRPWIVFTAGPMGVGKGYVLTQLHQAGVFPIQNFVKVDPDMIKSELPEMAGYLQAEKESAATKLHRESTQIADVLFEFALSKRLPILVDGSLRNVDYYQELFERIHRDAPSYRIAILHVTADREVIMDRAKRRAEKSGRVVPHDLLEESIKQVPQSVSILSKLADATHVIANNENKPLELVSSSYHDVVVSSSDESSHDRLDEPIVSSNPTWEEFARQWKEEDDNATADAAAVERCPKIEMPICHMATVFDCAESHTAANNIWAQAYPNFCARCALACDGQCGICIHGQHLCACSLCRHE